LYNSEALSALNFEFDSDFANIVVSGGEVESEWKAWLDKWAYMIDPVLQEFEKNIE